MVTPAPVSATPATRTQKLLWLTVALVALCVAVYAHATRDTRHINRRLSRLARLASKKQGESALTGLTRAREIMMCFSSNVVVDFGSPWPRAGGREELAAAIHHARSSVETLNVVVRDRTTTLSGNPPKAVTMATVEASADYRGTLDRDVRIFRIFWKKEPGGWVIERVEAADSIQRPPGLRAWES